MVRSLSCAWEACTSANIKDKCIANEIEMLGYTASLS